jgi:hypothetical protein
MDALLKMEDSKGVAQDCGLRAKCRARLAQQRVAVGLVKTTFRGSFQFSEAVSRAPKKTLESKPAFAAAGGNACGGER